MKRFLIAITLLSCMMAAAPGVINIDEFEDGNIDVSPNWWTFDASRQEVVDIRVFGQSAVDKFLGKKALLIKGETKGYYVGGMGTYLGVDASGVDTLRVYVWGNGPKSGRLTIQLYDDDNGNFVLEQDIENNYEPIFDDRFEYTVNVSWKGWKVLNIPLKDFKSTNLTVGDNTFNTNQENASGGLLHFQFIFLADEKEGAINMGIDNIKLVKQE